MSEPANRFVAAVPVEFQEQEIRWLVLEHDPEQSGGWFLFLHTSLDEPCEFDHWFLTKEEAESHALHNWGVGKDDWA